MRAALVALLAAAVLGGAAPAQAGFVDKFHAVAANKAGILGRLQEITAR